MFIFSNINSADIEIDDFMLSWKFFGFRTEMKLKVKDLSLSFSFTPGCIVFKRIRIVPQSACPHHFLPGRQVESPSNQETEDAHNLENDILI